MGAACELCGITQTNSLQLPPDLPIESAGRACPRCGQFYLVGSAVNSLPGLIAGGTVNRSVLSHRIRRRYDAAQKPLQLSAPDLNAFIGDTKPPTPQEQVDNLILWIGNNQQAPEGWAEATLRHLGAIVGAAVSATTDEPGVAWLLNQTKDSGLFNFTSRDNPTRMVLRLTIRGWERFAELTRRVVNSRTAFMAMKFNDTTLTQVLVDCFQPAVERAGFKLRSLSEAQPAGLIDNQIRAAIRTARFVIADLTHDNNGAYFEAGFAEGIGLPVIYTCEAQKFASKKTHFDTNHMKTVPWDVARLVEAGRELTATIRATLPGEAKLSDDQP